MNKATNSIHVRQTREYTAYDGVRRVFGQFAWPDMLRLMPVFAAAGKTSAWAAVLYSSLAEGAKGADAVMDIIETLFSERYCSSPLSRHDLTEGEHISVGEVQPLVDIAFELSGLTKKVSEPEDEFASQDSKFDIDECVFLVERYTSIDWEAVHALTWEQLLWHYEQILGFQLKYEMPIHGVDTRKAVRSFEAERARAAAGDGEPASMPGTTKLNQQKFDEMWNEWGKESAARAQAASGTTAKLQHLQTLLGGE